MVLYFCNYINSFESTLFKISYVFFFFLGFSDAEILALRAKLRIMQEEMEQISSDYYKKVYLLIAVIQLYCLASILYCLASALYTWKETMIKYYLIYLNLRSFHNSGKCFDDYNLSV